MYKLSKKKNGVLEIELAKVDFEDSFSAVHLRPYYLNKYGLQAGSRVTKDLQPTIYSSLVELINRINLFKPRTEVPNKTVSYEVTGRSKLIRSSDKSTIKLAYRKGGLSTPGGKAKSPNTCYLSESQAFQCYHSFKKEQGLYGNTYTLTPEYNRQLFNYWSDYMDKAYSDRAGVKYEKPQKREPVLDQDPRELELLYEGYAYVKPGTDRQILEDLASYLLCRINEKGTSLYDKDGYWICEIEEFENKDSEAFMISKIASRLNTGEIKRAQKVMDKYFIDSEESDFFSVFNNINSN